MGVLAFPLLLFAALVCASSATTIALVTVYSGSFCSSYLTSISVSSINTCYSAYLYNSGSYFSVNILSSSATGSWTAAVYGAYGCDSYSAAYTYSSGSTSGCNSFYDYVNFRYLSYAVTALSDPSPTASPSPTPSSGSGSGGSSSPSARVSTSAGATVGIVLGFGVVALAALCVCACCSRPPPNPYREVVFARQRALNSRRGLTIISIVLAFVSMITPGWWSDHFSASLSVGLLYYSSNGTPHMYNLPDNTSCHLPSRGFAAFAMQWAGILTGMFCVGVGFRCARHLNARGAAVLQGISAVLLMCGFALGASMNKACFDGSLTINYGFMLGLVSFVMMLFATMHALVLVCKPAAVTAGQPSPVHLQAHGGHTVVVAPTGGAVPGQYVFVTAQTMAAAGGGTQVPMYTLPPVQPYGYPPGFPTMYPPPVQVPPPDDAAKTDPVSYPVPPPPNYGYPYPPPGYPYPGAPPGYPYPQPYPQQYPYPAAAAAGPEPYPAPGGPPGLQPAPPQPAPSGPPGAPPPAPRDPYDPYGGKGVGILQPL